jgi:uncharacterized protein
MRPFHVAFPVQDIEKARGFYKNILGCVEGRSTEMWVDFNFFGHQVVFHKDLTSGSKEVINPVDGKNVPVPHFGIVLNWTDWESFIDSLRKKQVQFIIEPYTRFANKPGEQVTCFFYDPNGLALEFKAFKDDSMMFET